MVTWRFPFCQPRVQEIVIVVSRLLQVGNVGSMSLATLLAWGLWGLPSIRQWRDWRTWCWGQLEMHENSGECTGQWYSIHNSLFGKKTSFILSKSLFTRGWTFCHQIICWSCICPRRIPDFKEVPANRLKSPSGTDEQMNESSTGAKFKMKVHFWRAQIGTNCTFYGGIDLDILRWFMKFGILFSTGQSGWKGHLGFDMGLSLPNCGGIVSNAPHFSHHCVTMAQWWSRSRIKVSFFRCEFSSSSKQWILFFFDS